MKLRRVEQLDIVGHLDFPGYFAGASLKPPNVIYALRVSAPDFPGYFAGASLKPDVAKRYKPDLDLTSPATSPGPH